MKEIKLKETTYLIPQSWDEVTIEQQIEVERIGRLNPKVRMIGIISGYCGIPVSVLKKEPVKNLFELMGSLNFMKDQIPRNKELKWEISGHTYQVDKNISDMQFQDFVSLQTLLSDYKDRYYESLPLICSILAKREGETLDDYDIYQRGELFKKMPISIASSIAGFFLIKKRYSNLLSVLSSRDVQKNILLGKIKGLENMLNQSEAHRGGKLRTRFQIMIIKTYLTYLGKKLVKYFNSGQSKS